MKLLLVFTDQIALCWYYNEKNLPKGSLTLANYSVLYAGYFHLVTWNQMPSILFNLLQVFCQFHWPGWKQIGKLRTKSAWFHIFMHKISAFFVSSHGIQFSRAPLDCYTYTHSIKLGWIGSFLTGLSPVVKW